jgi:hypothetical protein
MVHEINNNGFKSQGALSVISIFVTVVSDPHRRDYGDICETHFHSAD